MWIFFSTIQSVLCDFPSWFSVLKTKHENCAVTDLNCDHPVEQAIGHCQDVLWHGLRMETITRFTPAPFFPAPPPPPPPPPPPQHTHQPPRQLFFALSMSVLIDRYCSRESLLDVSYFTWCPCDQSHAFHGWSKCICYSWAFDVPHTVEPYQLPWTCLKGLAFAKCFVNDGRPSSNRDQSKSCIEDFQTKRFLGLILH